MKDVTPWIAGIVTAVFAAMVVPAGPYWLDSGELSAAAVGLGVPHATGFPLYMVLAKLGSYVPFGELATRVHLVSAICAGATVAILCWLIIALAGESCASEDEGDEGDEGNEGDEGRARIDRLTVSLAGFFGSMVPLVSFLFLRHASVAEVYAPTALLFAIALLLLFRVLSGAGPGSGIMLAVVAGLGLGLHGSFRLLLGVPIGGVLILRLYRGARWPLFAPLITTACALTIHLYLPVRARVVPEALNWGHPETVSALFRHANASGLRDAFADSMWNTQSLELNATIAMAASQLGDHLGVLLGMMAILGLGFLFASGRGLFALVLLSVVLLDLVYAIFINPMGLSDWQNMWPTAVVAAVVFGTSLVGAGRYLRFAGPFAIPVLGIIALLPPALISWPQVWAGRSGRIPRGAAESFFAAAEPRAVVLTRSDSASANLLWMGMAEGQRPDVATVVRQLVLDRRRTLDTLERTGIQIAKPPADALDLARAVPRAVVWEYADDGLAPPGADVFTATASIAWPSEHGGALAIDLESAQAELESIYLRSELGDPLTRRFFAHGYTNLGRLALQAGDRRTAWDLFARALDVRPDHAEAAVNLGVLASLRGDFKQAAQLTEEVLAREPTRHRALINAGRYRMAMEDWAFARGHLLRALEVKDEGTGHALLAITCANLGDIGCAKEQLTYAQKTGAQERDIRAAEDALRKLK